MANFGLARLRLVSRGSLAQSAGAKDGVRRRPGCWTRPPRYDTLEEAIADCSLVLQPRRGPMTSQAGGRCGEAAALIAPRVAAGENVGVLFGRERYGLENHEAGCADRIVHAAGQSGVCLAQSGAGGGDRRLRVVKLAGAGLPFAMPDKSPPARKESTAGIFRDVGARVGGGRVFPPADKRRHHATQPAQRLRPYAAPKQDIRTLPASSRDRRWPQGAGQGRACSTAYRRRGFAR